MRLLLTALGSYGDVHPMVGLGAAMRSRGHRVLIIANPHFRTVVESAQLELLPLGTEQEYDRLSHHPDLWHPWRGPQMVLQTCMSGYLRELYLRELLESRQTHQQCMHWARKCDGQAALTAACELLERLADP
jgi:hypothetical protein